MKRIDRSEWQIVVVGAGAAGVAAAEAFSRMEPRPSVLVLSEEDRLPYKRTKISKHIARPFEREEFARKPHQWYAAHGVGLALGARAVSLNPNRRRLELADGTVLSWERLILAGGADPILPELAFPLRKNERVFVVRTAGQVEALQAALREVGRVAVVGTGVLGLEVAEQIRLLGKQVTLIGRDEQLMPRQLGQTAAADLREVLAANGVDLRLEESLVAVERRRVGYAVGLSREEVEADLLVFCLGVRPRLDLAIAGGLRSNHGILVDECLRTSYPEILAAGDVAEHPDGTVTHLWHAAEHQGELAARGAAGEAVRHRNPPFRLKCEVFGQYLFSMNAPLQAGTRRRGGSLPAVAGAARPPAGVQEPDGTAGGLGIEACEERQGGVYRCLYLRGNRLVGVVMINDRDRAKVYERAVREGWSRRRVAAELPLP